MCYGWTQERNLVKIIAKIPYYSSENLKIE